MPSPSSRALLKPLGKQALAPSAARGTMANNNVKISYYSIGFIDSSFCEFLISNANADQC